MNKDSEMGEVKHNNRAFDDLVAEMKRDHPSEMALAGEWAAGWADGVKHGAAQIDALRAENAELVAALDEIANPVKFMREQLQDGEQLNGLMAREITSSPDFYKKIARSALAKYRVDGKLVTSCYN